MVDRGTEDFTRLDRRYNAVVDAVGKLTFGRCRHVLKPRGRYLSTELGPWSQNLALAVVTPLFAGRRVTFPYPRRISRWSGTCVTSSNPVASGP